MQQQSQEKYSYTSQPHAAPVKKNKTKYRDENDDQLESSIGNLMSDPRVIRGSTYGAKGQDMGKKTMGSTSTRNDPPISRKKFTGSNKRSSTPPPVDGRIHMDMQTDDFLEELTDRPIEIDVETQTQPFGDRPASPLFVRASTGQDMETQILPGDLFDFNLEVEPLLEILVGKTLHVAMLELMQEEELESIRLQQQEFESLRDVELSEVQRLEAAARRRAQEKERRLAQEKKRVADKRALEEKIIARSFSQHYLGSLHTAVFDDLQADGLFYDPVHREIEDVFMTNLLSQIRTKTDCYAAAQQMALELIEGARAKARAFEADAIRMRKELAQREAEEKARLLAEAAAKKAEEERLALEREAAGEAVETE